MKRIIIIYALLACFLGDKLKAQMSPEEYAKSCHRDYKYDDKESINFYNPYTQDTLIKNKPINTYFVINAENLLYDLDSLRLQQQNIRGLLIGSKFYDGKSNRSKKNIETLCKTQNIKYIDLLGYDNEFKIRIPQCFKEKCKKLEGLRAWLSPKQFKSLSPYLYNIKWLGLYIYGLKNLPKHIYNLRNVEYLYLHSRLGFELDENFLYLSNIKFFSFHIDLENFDDFTKTIDILSQLNTLRSLELIFSTFPYEYDHALHREKLNKIIKSIHKLGFLKKLCVHIGLRNVEDFKDFEEKVMVSLPQTEVVIDSYAR